MCWPITHFTNSFHTPYNSPEGRIFNLTLFQIKKRRIREVKSLA